MTVQYIPTHNDLHTARECLLSARDTLTRALFSPHAVGPCVFSTGDFITKAAAALGLPQQANGDLVKALKNIIDTYDRYRKKGVLPAPAEYADVVEAINIARATVAAASVQEPQPISDWIKAAELLRKAAAFADGWIFGSLQPSCGKEARELHDEISTFLARNGELSHPASVIEALEAAELEQERSDQAEQERAERTTFGVRVAAQPEREAALVNGINALLGLIALVRVRSDCPEEISAILRKSHRIAEAKDALAAYAPLSEPGGSAPENAVTDPISPPSRIAEIGRLYQAALDHSPSALGEGVDEKEKS